MGDKLHNVRITKSKCGNDVFIDDKLINGVLKANVKFVGGEKTKLILIMDANVEIETEAEIKEVQAQ